MTAHPRNTAIKDRGDSSEQVGWCIDMTPASAVLAEPSTTVTVSTA
jgi:hypothetical protein